MGAGGVHGREMGGALRGERNLIGVGELADDQSVVEFNFGTTYKRSMASASFEAELVGRDDAAKEAVRVRVGGGGSNEAGGSGELVKSMTSCAQFEMVLWPFRCGGLADERGGGIAITGCRAASWEKTIRCRFVIGSSSSLSSSESETTLRACG